MVEIKDCPFCGCKMKSDQDYAIYGNHKPGCYFYFVNNQNNYDFTKESDLIELITAWNSRKGMKPSINYKELVDTLQDPFVQTGSCSKVMVMSRAAAAITELMDRLEEAEKELNQLRKNKFAGKIHLLTPERLCEMIGNPVFIEDKKEPENTGWVIWSESFNKNWLNGKDRDEYRKTWTAYTYHPSNIDQDALSCAGCDYLDRENVPCAHCLRAAGYADYYKPMAGLEK